MKTILKKTKYTKLLKSIILPLGLIAIANSAYSSPCPVKFISHANSLAPEIMKLNGDFSNNTTPSVTGCYYNKAENSASLNMTIAWNGPLTGDLYWVKGILQISPDENIWRTTAKNNNKKGFDLFDAFMTEMTK